MVGFILTSNYKNIIWRRKRTRQHRNNMSSLGKTLHLTHSWCPTYKKKLTQNDQRGFSTATQFCIYNSLVLTSTSVSHTILLIVSSQKQKDLLINGIRHSQSVRTENKAPQKGAKSSGRTPQNKLVIGCGNGCSNERSYPEYPLHQK